MSFGVWAWVAFALLVVSPLVTGVLGWRFGLYEGEHRGRCAERDRQVERTRRAAERKFGSPPEIRAKTGPLFPAGHPWNRVSVIPPASRTATTAADIAPVIIPQPKPTDTGEIRALTAETDAWLEGMRQKGLIT